MIIAEGGEVDSKNGSRQNGRTLERPPKSMRVGLRRGLSFSTIKCKNCKLCGQKMYPKGWKRSISKRKKGHGREAERSSEEIIPSKCAE
jgi:hypothetical protein